MNTSSKSGDIGQHFPLLFYYEGGELKRKACHTFSNRSLQILALHSGSLIIGLFEARLLLIKNFSQHPIIMTWSIVGRGNFWQSLWRLNYLRFFKKKADNFLSLQILQLSKYLKGKGVGLLFFKTPPTFLSILSKLTHLAPWMEKHHCHLLQGQRRKDLQPQIVNVFFQVPGLQEEIRGRGAW